MPFGFFGLFFVDMQIIVKIKNRCRKFFNQIMNNFAKSVFINMQILQNFR